MNSLEYITIARKLKTVNKYFYPKKKKNNQRKGLRVPTGSKNYWSNRNCDMKRQKIVAESGNCEGPKYG